jgi:hypothetical protein
MGFHVEFVEDRAVYFNKFLLEFVRVPDGGGGGGAPSVFVYTVGKGKGKVVCAPPTEHHAMKACWGSGVQLHPFFYLDNRRR